MAKAKRSPTKSPVEDQYGRNFKIEWKTTNQKLAWLAFQKHDIVFLTGPAGSGKAQPLYSKIYTPNGYTLMKDIEVGDVISTVNGDTAKVTGIFPQGKKDIYRVSFSDGFYTDCCMDHLWKVKCDRNGWADYRVMSLKEIVEYGLLDSRGHKNFNVPMSGEVYFEHTNVEVDPYLVGFLLGDGGLSQNTVRFSTVDLELVDKIDGIIGENHYIKKLCKTGTCDYIIGGLNRENKIKLSLEKYNLMFCRSYEKFIPNEYKYNSIDVRKEIIRGLMDSDGTVCKKSGQAIFCTTSEQLSKDFCEITQSLGYTPRVRTVSKYYKYKGKRKAGRLAYQIAVGCTNPSDLFSLLRKKNLCKVRTKYHPKRLIESVVKISEEEAQCIMIDHPDHLYLTDNFIVTHNTHLAMAYALSEFLEQKKKKIVLTRPIIESGGEKLGFLPGNKEEKTHPFMMPFYDVIDKMSGGDPVTKERIYNHILIEPTAYMKGRTYENAVCIFDEAQDATNAQLKLFMTRFGKGSKIIICGDVTQSDIEEDKIALPRVLSNLQNLPGVGSVEFNRKDNQRHPLVEMILDNW